MPWESFVSFYPLDADPEGRNVTGESYVVFGSAAGFEENLNLSALDGANGFRMDGIHKGDGSGVSVAGAGDVNGDGLDDLIVGASESNPAGKSYVVFGFRTPIRGGPGSDELAGTAFDDRMFGRTGDDVLDGREGQDRLKGGPGDDFLGGGAGRDRIIGGLDDDRLTGGGGADVFVFKSAFSDPTGCRTSTPIRTAARTGSTCAAWGSPRRASTRP